jgi:hypothetical protein
MVAAASKQCTHAIVAGYLYLNFFLTAILTSRDDTGFSLSCTHGLNYRAATRTAVNEKVIWTNVP